MVYEFEGRTEKEAIDRAAKELGLQKDDFDVEILEAQRSGLFKKGYVKIQVHTSKLGQTFGMDEDDEAYDTRPLQGKRRADQSIFGDPQPKNEFEKQVIEFVEGLIEKMGYSGKVRILFREDTNWG